MRKHLGIAIVVLGLVIALFPFANNWYTDYHNEQKVKQLKISQKVANEIQTSADNITEVSTETESEQQVVNATALSSYKRYVGTDDIANSSRPQDNRLLIYYDGPNVEASADGLTYLGTLEIPSIDLNMPLVDGAKDEDIAISAGHMLNTAYPGQIGNSVIVGHRGYSHGRLFNRLDELQKGHKIIVNSGEDTFTYTVYKTKVVLPTDTSVINQTDQTEVLTLITCTPLFSSEYRLVVHAVMD